MQIKKITRLEGQDHKKDDDKIFEIETEETKKRFASLSHLRRQKTDLENELSFVNLEIQQIESQQAQ